MLGATACNDASTGDATQVTGGDPATALTSEINTRTGAVVTSAGQYIFTPSSCAFGVEDGIDDIEIGGPGNGPDGEPVYVEFSSTGNELDVNLGTDLPFTTTEHRLVAGQHVTRPIEFSVSGKSVRATGIALANEQGEIIDNEASFEADCRPAG